MKRDKDILEKYDGHRPFTVPDGYFNNLTDRIMASLPEEESSKASPVTVTTWMRIKPYLYMAAAFAGIFFCIKVAVGLTSRHNTPEMAQTEEPTIYSDEYIDSFLETAMIDDCTLYYTLVDTNIN